MKIIGMPGAVKTIAAARVERFWAKKPSARRGAIASGKRALAVRRGDLVMALGVKNPLERVVVEALADEARERVHVAGLVPRRDEAPRRVCMKPAPHCALKPAPP